MRSPGGLPSIVSPYCFLGARPIGSVRLLRVLCSCIYRTILCRSCSRGVGLPNLRFHSWGWCFLAGSISASCSFSCGRRSRPTGNVREIRLAFIYRESCIAGIVQGCLTPRNWKMESMAISITLRLSLRLPADKPHVHRIMRQHITLDVLKTRLIKHSRRCFPAPHRAQPFATLCQ